jgi:O-antigen ligase
MVTECLSALCTLGIVVIAILVITRTISVDDALKSIGKAFVLMLVLYFAVCMLAGPVSAGLTALVALLAKVVRWLVVAVIVAGLLILAHKRRQ